MDMVNRVKKRNLVELVREYHIGKFVGVKPVATSGNFSYVIGTSRGKYFLRLCGDNLRWRSQKEIAGELNLIAWLKESGFPVIDGEITRSGKRVISIGGRNGYLRKYAAGRQIKGDPNPGQLLSAGRFLGKYHRIVSAYGEISLRKNINFGLEATKRYFNQEKNNILASNFKNKDKFAAVFQSEIIKITLPRNLARGMIHEDLGKRHVLWRGSDIAAIIDFDRSYYGCLLLDLGQALRGWCFTDNWRHWSKDSLKHFLAGYESERRLPARERKYLLSAIRFAILERALAFCTRYIYSIKPDKKDEAFANDSLFRQIKKIAV